MTANIIPAAAGRVLAAGLDWDDVINNMFTSWAGWAAAGSIMICGTVGLLMLGTKRMSGIAMILVGFILCGVFLNVDKGIQMSNNQVKNWEQPTSNDNPFKRGS